MTNIKHYCASCAFFNWVVFPGKKTTCDRSGSLPSTPSCSEYSPNPFVLQDVEKLLLPLANILKRLPVSVIPILYDVISNEKLLRKQGYAFMEKVAVRYRGTENDNYVSNFTIARVFSTAPEDSLYVVSEKGYRMLVLRSSVIKYNKFMEIRKEWVSEGNVVDPEILSEQIPRIKQIHGVPETLDDLVDLDMVETDSKLRRLLSSKKFNRDIEDLSKGKDRGTLKARITANEEFRISRDSAEKKKKKSKRPRRLV